MSAFFKKLGQSLADIFTSKKVLMGIATAVVQVLPIGQDVKNSVLGIGGAVILGQAASDFGKNKK